MNNFFKTISVVLVLLIVGVSFFGAYNALIGNLFLNAPISGVLILVALALVVYGAWKGIRSIVALSLLCAVFTLQGCSYAKSNQQVVYSSDCGVTWQKINIGESVPKGTMNPCFQKVVMPNFPMQGDMKFLANLEGKVKVISEIDYDYNIVEPLSFIREAKTLGKSNADADSSEALDQSAFEGAENRVIDKRLKDVAKRLFLEEDIVNLDQADLEEKLLDESNKVLEKYGVKLNFITLTFLPDEQTRQAIDISTAMRIYRNNDLEQIGQQVMVARAGATQITVENKTVTTPTEN